MAVVSVTLRFEEVGCRHCGGELAEVNPGHADGCRATWVGACCLCRRQWVVTASMAQVPTRGRTDNRQGALAL